MFVGGYEVHLYCDEPDATLPGGADNAYHYPGHYKPGEFTGETRAECIRAARRRGWTLRPEPEGSRGGYHVRCPHHKTLSSTGG